MNGSWKSKCLAILGAMNSQRDIVDQVELYSLVLDVIGEEYATAAVQYAMLHCDWRPTPAELRSTAARLASPLPNEGDCFDEFWEAVKFSRETPEWFHPIIGDVVQRMGGWEYFRSMRPHWSDVDMRSIWFPRFMEAWKSSASAWVEAVAEQLSMPSAMRDARFRVGEPVAVRPIPPAELKIALMPPPVLRIAPEPPEALRVFLRERLQIKSVPATPKIPALSREERKRLDDEARLIASKPAPTAEEVDQALEEARRKHHGRDATHG